MGVHPPIHPSIHPSVQHPSVRPSIYPFIRPPVHLSIQPSVCPSIPAFESSLGMICIFWMPGPCLSTDWLIDRAIDWTDSLFESDWTIEIKQSKEGRDQLRLRWTALSLTPMLFTALMRYALKYWWLTCLTYNWLSVTPSTLSCCGV